MYVPKPFTCHVSRIENGLLTVRWILVSGSMFSLILDSDGASISFSSMSYLCVTEELGRLFR